MIFEVAQGYRAGLRSEFANPPGDVGGEELLGVDARIAGTRTKQGALQTKLEQTGFLIC